LIALVGYTNAGKSTLFNTLSRASVTVENRLFSTLDPVTRRIRLPGGQAALITDTVGFIHKLPPSIIAAFRTTLEELDEADLLVHVVDITHADAPQQHATVEQILADIGLSSKPVLTVLNKMDLLQPSGSGIQPPPAHEDPRFTRTDFVAVSAVTGWNVPELLERIEGLLAAAVAQNGS
jgi:GTP-binding protein HflX